MRQPCTSENPAVWGRLMPFAVATGIALRLSAVPQTVGDVDSVNHAAALRGFDPFVQAPHFPGYPVYTAVTQALSTLGVADVWALALPGIATFAVAGPALYWALAGWVGREAALFCVGLCAVAPGAVAAGAWPASDGLGLSLLLLTAACVLAQVRMGRWGGLGGLFAGLTLGVRLSYAPALVPLVAWGVWSERRAQRSSGSTGRWYRLRLIWGGLTGTALWAIPMVWLFGAGRLVELGAGFVGGHFVSFGGTALAVGRGLRPGRWLWGLWDATLGAAYPWSVPDMGPGLDLGLASDGPIVGAHGWPETLVALGLIGTGILVGLRRLQGSTELKGGRISVWLFLPYALWLLLGQNPDKPRHLLPLVPIVGVLLSSARLGPYRPTYLLALFAVVALPRARAQHQMPVPAVAVARYMGAQAAEIPTLVLAGPEARLLDVAVAHARVLRPLNFEVARAEALRAHRLGVRVLMTSSIPGFERGPQLSARLHARFPVSVRPQDVAISLFEFNTINGLSAVAGQVGQWPRNRRGQQ